VAEPEDTCVVLERIGAYAPGELFGEEARQVERLVLESSERRRLADSYTCLLTLLSSVGEEAPDVMLEDVLRRVDIEERWPPRQEEERRHEKVRDRRTSAFGRTSKPQSEKNLGLVWINSPYEEEMTLLAKEALGEMVRVHIDTEPPWGEAPCCCVLICPNDDEVVSQMRHLRSQVLDLPVRDLPVVVFCRGKELRLVEQALWAGASGFVYAEMRPEKIALALSLASEGEVFIPRELLVHLIGQRLFLRRPRLFDP
jgi:DNA-binding NarL/FixJ family response regulator